MEGNSGEDEEKRPGSADNKLDGRESCEFDQEGSTKEKQLMQDVLWS